MCTTQHWKSKQGSDKNCYAQAGGRRGQSIREDPQCIRFGNNSDFWTMSMSYLCFKKEREEKKNTVHLQMLRKFIRRKNQGLYQVRKRISERQEFARPSGGLVLDTCAQVPTAGATLTSRYLVRSSSRASCCSLHAAWWPLLGREGGLGWGRVSGAQRESALHLYK